MAVPIVMPRLGDFMTEGVVAKWAKAAGDEVAQGEVVAEIESEKLNYDLEAAQAGIFHPSVEEGATVEVDGILGYLLAAGEAPPEASAPAGQSATPAATSATPAPAPRTPTAPSGDVVPSTPGARKLAAGLGIDISQITPSGPRGRVVEADVRAYADQQRSTVVASSPSPATSPRTPAPANAPAPAPHAAKAPPGLPEPSRVEPLEGIRRAIARNMRDSLTRTAPLSYHLEIDVTEAQRLRREASREGEDSIALAHVLIKACAETLKRVPALNSVLAEDAIQYFDVINIGIAVALDEGLIVPVLKDVGNKDLRQIAAEARDLADKARRGGLSNNDVVGGTFTISVLGVVDGFTPILSPGVTALMGVGRSLERPVVRDGQIVVREMMTANLTADHQVIDGAVAVAYMRRFQRLMESPAALFR